MSNRSRRLPPSLFDDETPAVDLSPPKKKELRALVEAMLAEIAIALANREASDDQDHG